MSFPCPNCGTEMVNRFAQPRSELHSPIPVKQCPKCWCVFLTTKMQEELNAPDRLRTLKATEDGGRRCPTCQRQMRTLNVRAVMKLTTKVELDRCPACEGVLLDPGELGDLLSRTVSISGNAEDDYLKRNPKRVSSAMGDPAGPWTGQNGRVDLVGALAELIEGNDN